LPTICDQDFFVDKQKAMLKQAGVNHFTEIYCVPVNAPLYYWSYKYNSLVNILFENSCDYILKVIDDVVFVNNNWVETMTAALDARDGIGVVGSGFREDLINAAMFTQKHLETFNNIFNPYLTSWFTDDWMNDVYGPKFTTNIPNFIKHGKHAPHIRPARLIYGLYAT